MVATTTTLTLALTLTGHSPLSLAQTPTTIPLAPSDAACATSWDAIYAAQPTLPPTLSTAYDLAHTTTNTWHEWQTLGALCSFESAFASAPTDQASYSTYLSQYGAWYAASSGVYQALIAQCPQTAVYGPATMQASEAEGFASVLGAFAVTGCDVTATVTSTATRTTRVTAGTVYVTAAAVGRPGAVLAAVGGVVGAVLAL